VRMGRYAMVGGKSKIVQDVLPFFITDGNPPRVRGLNSVGLRRAGFPPATMSALKKAYQALFRNGLALEEAVLQLERIEDPHVVHLVQFIKGSKRGFHRGVRKGDEELFGDRQN
jgi:UDP-N-acetylglucosamine acyltransferase